MRLLGSAAVAIALLLALAGWAALGLPGASPATPAAGETGEGTGAGDPGATTHALVRVEAEEGAPSAQPVAVAETAGGAPAPAQMMAGAFLPSPKVSYEPTVGVTSKGVLFLSAYDARIAVGVSGLPDRTTVQRSDDQGATWVDVTPRVAGVPVTPNDNDPYLHVDPDTDRVFVSASQMAACTVLSFSDDLGASWTTTPLGCGASPGLHDHQTLWTAKPRKLQTVGYPNVVHLCVNRGGSTGCAQSLNGGLSFGPYNEVVWPLEAQAEIPCGGTIGLTGHGAAAPDGAVYPGGGVCGRVAVARSADDGLTWTSAYLGPEALLAELDASHEVDVAVDAAGNVYAAWIGRDLLPYLAVSLDHGETWGPPLRVAPPEVGAADFPALVAGDEGRVAVAYYGSPVAKAYEAFGELDPWNAYLTLVLDALAPGPTGHTVTLHEPDDPMARGVCGGTRCDGAGTAGVGDFIGMSLDAEGRPWVALVDVCEKACPDGGKSRGVGGVGTLLAGPRLRGEGWLPPLRGGA